MSDDKIDDRIHIVPRGAHHLGATCASCDRCWNLSEHVSLRDVKVQTRHQCSATAPKQKTWPEVEEPSTSTDPESLRNTIAEVKRMQHGYPSCPNKPCP